MQMQSIEGVKVLAVASAPSSMKAKIAIAFHKFWFNFPRMVLGCVTVMAALATYPNILYHFCTIGTYLDAGGEGEAAAAPFRLPALPGGGGGDDGERQRRHRDRLKEKYGHENVVV